MSNAERRLKNEEVVYKVQSTEYGLEFFSPLDT